MKRKYGTDYTGMKFGMVTITRKDKGRRWFGTCDCGSPEKSFLIANLVTGSTQTCSCGRIKHGLSKKEHATYCVWFNMLDRCFNKKHRYYRRYGGRGIKVAQRWMKFENFFADMGRKPPKHTLERKKNDEGYSKSNCCWATMKTQANNKGNNKLIALHGKTQTQQQWIEELPHLKGKRHIVYQRISAGWSEEEALLTPVRAKSR